MDRRLKDIVAGKLMLIATAFPILLLFLIITGLEARSAPILEMKSIEELIFSSAWHPFKGEFGLLPFIAGTLYVTALAMIISIPVSLLGAIFLAEYASINTRQIVKPLLDLLAGIPSVVYGLWGVLAIVPLIRDLASFFGVKTTGYSLIAGAIVLAIMVFPVIISVLDEVFRSIPNEFREASLALGATKWEMIKHVVIRKAVPGIIAAVILGFSRAIGETMTVLMVVGNVPRIPRSIFEPAYPLPALIANNYGEMMSIPLYDSALMLAALMLLTVVLLFTAGASFILIKTKERVI
jgi:phosphate transport system permease protein